MLEFPATDDAVVKGGDQNTPLTRNQNKAAEERFLEEHNSKLTVFEKVQELVIGIQDQNLGTREGFGSFVPPMN